VTHRELKAAGFPAPYAKALAKAKISASRLDLARSAITLRPTYYGERSLGAFWWIVRGISTVFTTLNANLTPKPGFMMSPASYRSADSFVLAEALTHWTAQAFLDVDVLLPVERCPHAINLSAAGATASKTMPAGYRSPRKNTGLKSTPDFVGLGAATHVIESKGRANFGVYGVTNATKTTARNKALHQVCRVNTVNGAPPATRTACVFSFEHASLSGWIDDPPAFEQSNLEMRTDEMLRAYYGLVLDPLFEEFATPRDGFVGLDVAPGWRLSIDKRIFEEVRGLDGENSADRVRAALRERRTDLRAAGKPEDGSSIGPDGIRLDGPADFDLPPLRKKPRA